MKHSYSKSELATMAGVSYSTFYRYLKTRRSRFNQMGLTGYSHGFYYRMGRKSLGRFGFSVMKPKTRRRLNQQRRQQKSRKKSR